MYNSQYYTCEQIDQRLLQGYLDDYNSQNNTNLTKAEFLALLFNTLGRNSTVDNLVTQIGYYECDTAVGTAAKVLSVANYALFAGGALKVKFVNKNTANNATLNINSQGAKALYYQGERASATNSWDDNEVVEIYYDGTSYYANNIKGGSGSGVYDVSKEHPTSGPNGDGKFTLEYILNSSNVNELIPINKREPGMTIQFVSTSDNKYVQYRLMSKTWSTNISNWQGVDAEPVAGSKNLVESSGVKQQIAKINYGGNVFAWDDLSINSEYILYSTGNKTQSAAGMFKHVNKAFYVTQRTYIRYKIYGQGGADIALIAIYDVNNTYKQEQSVKPSSSSGFVEGELTIQQDGHIEISFNETSLNAGIPLNSYFYFDADYIKQDEIQKNNVTKRIDSDRDNITLSDSVYYNVYQNESVTNARISNAETGAITNDASWRLTGYVSLKTKPVSFILLICNNEDNVRIAYYDKDKQYIGCYQPLNNQGPTNGRVIPIYDIPSNAYYLRHCYPNFGARGCLMYFKNTTSICRDVVFDMSINIGSLSVVTNGHLQSNGINTGMSTYKTTMWIKVPQNYTIVVNGYDSLGAPLAIKEYRFVNSCSWGPLTSANDESVICLTASESDMYFICELGGESKDTYVPKYSSPEIRIYKESPFVKPHNKTIERNLNYDIPIIYKEGLKALFANVLCIGDSITEGVLATGTTGNRLPYPSVLSEITSWNVTNAGSASKTAVSWVSNYLNTYDYSAYDAFIIYFGTNDTINNTLSGDFDGDTNYSSPDDYAATTEGQYARLVETILTQNLNSKIFLLRGGYSCNYMNICIKKLNEKYSNTYILDVYNAWDSIWLRNPIYHSSNDKVHFNQLGYCVFASKVFDLLAKSLVE